MREVSAVFSFFLFSFLGGEILSLGDKKNKGLQILQRISMKTSGTKSPYFLDMIFLWTINTLATSQNWQKKYY